MRSFRFSFTSFPRFRHAVASRWMPLLAAVAVGAIAWPAFAATATTTALAITVAGTPVTSVNTGQAATFTATVFAAGNPVNGGRVNFCDAVAKLCSDIHLLGSSTVASTGTASLTLTLGPGVHQYKAVYVPSLTATTSGGVTTFSSAYTTSSSTASQLSVLVPTAITLSQSGSQGSYTLKAGISGLGLLAAPTGTVNFLDTSNSNATLGSASLVAGTPATPVWAYAAAPILPPNPQSILTGDFNGDGIPDLAVGSPNFVSILLGNGDGTFKAPTNIASPLASNTTLLAANFVKGGPLDLLTISNIASTSPSGAAGVLNSALLIGNGAGGGTMNAATALGETSIAGAAAGDFDGDGNLDFVVTGLAFNVGAFSDVPGKGDGTFGAGNLNAVATNAPTGIVVCDVNGDGTPDIAVAEASGEIDVFVNPGPGYFFPVYSQVIPAGSAAGITSGDFNGDGFADLAVANPGSGSVSIMSSNGFAGQTGTFTVTTVPAGPNPIAVTVGDFNGDGIADLAVLSGTNASITILTGKGDGTFTNTATLSPGFAGVGLVAGNFGGTGLNELAQPSVTSNPTTGTVTILTQSVTQTATATTNNIAPSGGGTHAVDASYSGDTRYGAGVSATTALTGTATPGALTLAPASLTFSSQAINTTSTAQTVMVTNTGGTAVSFSSIAGSTYFTVVSACGNSLNAGATCAFNVTFAPAVPGTISGTVTVTSNAPGSPQTIALTGTAYTPAPVVALAPTSLTFATQAVGTSSAAQTIMLSNTGNAALTITSIAANGDFAQANTCGVQVAAASSCLISVTFTPTATGARTGSITLTDNATGSPQTIALTGTGFVSAPAATLAPTTLTFAAQNVGSTSAAQTVTLANGGTGTLALTSITASAGFAQTNTCAGTVAAGASCTISVTFAPTAGGAATGTLTVADNATGSPQTVALSGTGSTVAVTLGSSTLNVPASGGTVTDLLTYSASGSFNGTVNLTCAVTYSGTGTASNTPTCSLSPTQIQVTATVPGTSTLTVKTVGATAMLQQGSRIAYALMLCGLLVRRRRLRHLKRLMLCLLLSGAVLTGMMGCSSAPAATRGSYAVTVTASSAALTITTTIPLTVQ